MYRFPFGERVFLVHQHDHAVAAVGDDAQPVPGYDAAEHADVGGVFGDCLHRLLAGAFLQVDADP